MVSECPKLSNASKGPFFVWFIASTSCLFTALIIAQSLRQGRLSLPADYDDVSYFVDAARRLQLLYDNGIVQCFVDLFRNPPHAPIGTLVPFVGFLVFGMNDWAPAAVNVVWVALLLYFIKLLLPEVPRWAYATVALTALTWPVTAIMVVECRPDMYAALLTVMGSTLMLRSPFLHATTRHIAVVAALFGAALLAKPTTSPVTLLLYGASLAIAVIIEGRSLDRKSLSKAALRVSQSLAITIAIALPYFIFAWRDIYTYVYTMTMGSQKAYWADQLSASAAANWYLWGPGGHIMMGAWLRITIFLVSADIIIGWLTRRPWGIRNIGIVLVFLFAYALFSIPSVKSPWLGSTIAIFLMTFYVIACGGIIGSLTTMKNYGRPIAIGFAAALLITSMAVFHWTWWVMPTISHLTATRHYEVLRQLADYFESHADEHAKETIVFPVSAEYVTPETLQFEFQKRRLKNINTVSYLFSVAQQRAALKLADYVVLFDKDDPALETRFPDLGFYSQVIALVELGFEKEFEIQAADLHHKIAVYGVIRESKVPFRGLSQVSGFLPIEGPWPQWNLPLVMWGTGYSARAQFLADKLGEGHLVLRARSPLAGQSVDVRFDGKPVGTCDLSIPYVFVGCSFSVNISQPMPVIDLSFSKSGPAEDLERSVLFSELRLDPNGVRPGTVQLMDPH